MRVVKDGEELKLYSFAVLLPGTWFEIAIPSLSAQVVAVPNVGQQMVNVPGPVFTTAVCCKTADGKMFNAGSCAVEVYGSQAILAVYPDAKLVLSKKGDKD